MTGIMPRTALVKNIKVSILVVLGSVGESDEDGLFGCRAVLGGSGSGGGGGGGGGGRGIEWQG